MTVLEQVRSCCAWPFATVNAFRSNKHVAPAIASGQPPPPHPPAALRSKLAVGPRQHGPSSNKMARITSDCDAMQRRDRRPGVLELAHRPEQRRAPAYSCTPLWIIPTAAASPGLQLHSPMDNPCCSCKLHSAASRPSHLTSSHSVTRLCSCPPLYHHDAPFTGQIPTGLQLHSLWIIPNASVKLTSNAVMAYSCNPLWIIPTAAVS